MTINFHFPQKLVTFSKWILGPKMGGGIFGFALAFFEEDKLVIDFTSCHKNS